MTWKLNSLDWNMKSADKGFLADVTYHGSHVQIHEAFTITPILPATKANEVRCVFWSWLYWFQLRQKGQLN